jgi:hypothetical protein
MRPEAHFFDWGMFWQAASAIATTAAVIVALWQTKYVNKKRAKLIYGEHRKIVVQQLGVELPDGFRYNLNEDIEFDRPLCCFPIELEPEQFIKCLWLNDDFRDLLVTRHLHENNKRITFYIQDSAGIYYKRKTTKTPKQFLEEN